MPRHTMADKETNQKNGAKETAPEKKVVTRYEKRLARRKEQEAAVRRKHNMTAGIAAAVVLLCVGVGGYKAYDSYQEKNGPYISVGSHKISRNEFNYQYNNAINSFYSQYGSFASYMGLDLSSPLDQQYYSDNMTWKDYFERQAATQLQQVYALTDEAKAQGFEYDAAGDVEDFVESLQSSADSAEMSIEDYCVQAFGEGMTVDEVKGYVEMSAVADAYYQKVKSEVVIEDDAVNTYYDENKNDYDSVDYKLAKIEADIPEPETEEVVETEAETEAAAETSDETAAETEAETEVETETETEDNSAEIQAAMDDAKAKAEAMKAVVKDAASFEAAAPNYVTDTEAEVSFTDAKYSSVSSTLVADWLFDEGRAAGDVEVIEDTAGNAYYVAFFEKRYLDHIATANVRHILIQPEEVEDESEDLAADGTADVEVETETEADPEAEAAAQAAKEEAEAAAKADAKAEAERIYEEWKAGEATEDSFAALAEEYSEDGGSASDGGLYENVEPGQMVAEFNDWVFDENRKTGDTDIVETSYGYHIMYYVSAAEESWFAQIKNTLIDEHMSEYMEGLLENVPVSDPRGRLAYLAAEAAETETEAASETGAESETASGTAAESEAASESASETGK